MNILVTGATGFIGKHLTKRLIDQGHTVLCLARNNHRAESLRSLGVTLVIGDLSSLGKQAGVLDGVEVIYHLAGVMRARSTGEYYEGNYLATKELIETCKNHCAGFQRFVYVSSLAAVGPASNGEPLTEEAAYHPVSHYGRSKMLGEREVRKAADLFPATILRPVAVYGPGDAGFFEYFRLVKRGILPVIGWDRKSISIIYVDDLVTGITNAACNPKAIGKIYFLGDDQPYTIEEIGETVATVMGLRPTRIHLPAILAYAYGAVSEITGKITHNGPVQPSESERRSAARVDLFDGKSKS